ncbi:hypothetical protein AB5J55_24520 [Streptomyces sp. R11]|uniref:Uncharacterized protein n=1 Tax=Streptomyces sp. R11 TaxID=3238625 RepID=A0AB39N3Z4_9ACTN
MSVSPATESSFQEIGECGSHRQTGRRLHPCPLPGRTALDEDPLTAVGRAKSNAPKTSPKCFGWAPIDRSTTGGAASGVYAIAGDGIRDHFMAGYVTALERNLV